MYKEMIIVLVVIVSIISIDIITNNYTTYATNTLFDDLNNLRENVISENKENIDKKIVEIESKWKEYKEVLAYYIEHDELEKIETELETLKGGLEVKDYKHCIGNLDATSFMLEHLQDKEKFTAQSIF